MADLVLTFGKSIVPTAPRGAGFPDFPVMMGSAARSEAVAIGMVSAPSTLAAIAGETYVTLTALAACWVAFGPAPTAAALASGGTATGVSWYMGANEVREFSVATGDKVAVIAAA